MIEYDEVEVGDMLSVEKGVLMHGCNAQGVMGSGIAASIRMRYPKAYEEYFSAYRNSRLKLGEVIIVEVADDLYIANCITQFDFGRDPDKRYVKHSAVKTCFDKVINFANTANLPIHYPLIGAGLANGDWAVISSIIEDRWRAKGQTSKTLWLLD